VNRALILWTTTIIAVALSLAWILIPKSDQALKNQRQVIALLASARPIPGTPGTGGIAEIALGNHLRLQPEHEELVLGYTFRLRVQSFSFTVEATPVEVGKTGLYSLFRDASGVIHFELGRPATEHSRIL
jgi:hypothetical protein